MQSETEGLAAPSDAMFLAARSVDGNIDGGTYPEQSERFSALNEAIFTDMRSMAVKINGRIYPVFRIPAAIALIERSKLFSESSVLNSR